MNINDIPTQSVWAGIGGGIGWLAGDSYSRAAQSRTNAPNFAKLNPKTRTWFKFWAMRPVATVFATALGFMIGGTVLANMWDKIKQLTQY